MAFRVAQQAQVKRHRYPAQDQFAPSHQGVNVPTFTDSEIHAFFLVCGSAYVWRVFSATNVP